MKTSELEDLVADTGLLVQKVLSRWRRGVFEETWSENVSIEVLVEDFIDKLRRDGFPDA
jgi:hypothetical protein